MKIQSLFIFITIIILQAYYPVNKTTQPELEIIVMDENGQSIKDAKVTLQTEVSPAKVDLKENVKFTNAKGIVNFEHQSEMRVENVLIHGVQYYDWFVCVSKTGYQTHDLIKVEEKDQFKQLKIVLKKGQNSDRDYPYFC